MGTMQLLLFTVGLGLLSVMQAESPPLTPALAKELLGHWFIIGWAGNMPIPAKKKASPLPPFLFARNNLNKLEFRMNIKKPIGCVQFKLPLDEVNGKPGNYQAWSGHLVLISFLPKGKDHAIAYYEGKVVQTKYKMSMLMGRSLDEDPEAKQVFEELMDEKELNGTVVYPPAADSCVLAKES
ncbi:PREDICTED: lipocalin-1-like [Chinchilla lanigera]|uniref:lipocalin-1-like n=1 Tax=Chinchilla lanigera TaxID=34839 RepID=UPI00038EE557|nr:PREDICTED: lipocalin-1-like [Chinchilla lanigera]